MKLNGRKKLDEMEKRNSEEENQKFLVLNDKWLFTFNSRAVIKLTLAQCSFLYLLKTFGFLTFSGGI